MFIAADWRAAGSRSCGLASMPDWGGGSALACLREQRVRIGTCVGRMCGRFGRRMFGRRTCGLVVGWAPFFFRVFGLVPRHPTFGGLP